MTRAQLINKVARVTGSKEQAALAVGAILTAIQKEFDKGNAVTLRGLDTFSINKRDASIYGNPQTGVVIKMPASAFLD